MARKNRYIGNAEDKVVVDSRALALLFNALDELIEPHWEIVDDGDGGTKKQESEIMQTVSRNLMYKLDMLELHNKPSYRNLIAYLDGSQSTFGECQPDIHKIVITMLRQNHPKINTEEIIQKDNPIISIETEKIEDIVDDIVEQPKTILDKLLDLFNKIKW